MITRTDIHRPSAIIPADYEYVAVWTMNIQSLGDCDFIRQEREICKAHMERTKGTYSAHEHGGACDVCGNALAIYLVLFYHAKTNEYIRVGVNCAQKLDMAFDSDHMDVFKRNVSDAREAVAGKKKAIAILSDAGLIDAWTIFTQEFPKHDEGCKDSCSQEHQAAIRAFDNYEERTIRDIVGKLVKYGNVSENQKGFISKLLGNIARRPIIEAQRKAEHEAAEPVQSGRYEVSGTVLSMKEVEAAQYSYYSPETVWKLLIRLDNGAKVWGSRFANLEKGDRVSFTATFEQSKDDAKFGFYKRPVKTLSPEEAILAVFAKSWPVKESVL